MKDKILLPVAMVFLLVFSVTAYAQVSYFPHQFYGSVTINGVPAPDGVIVTATHNGDNVAAGGGGLTKDGKYGYERPAFVVALHSSYKGDTLEFFVNNVKAAEYQFTPGDSTKLDLSVSIPNFCGDGKCESGESCSSCPHDCGACGSGGSPSGGGGSSGGATGGGATGGTTTGGEEETGETTGTCTEKWICTEWTECFNGKQRRVCTDVNMCGTTENEPLQEQECVMPKICEPGEKTCRGDFLSECSPSGTTWVDVDECEYGCSDGKCMTAGPFGGLPTGMFIMLPAAAGLIVLIVIAMIVLYFVRIRK